VSEFNINKQQSFYSRVFPALIPTTKSEQTENTVKAEKSNSVTGSKYITFNYTIS